MKSIRRPQLVENGAKNLRPVGFETGRAAWATGWSDTRLYQTRLCHDSMRCFKKKLCIQRFSATQTKTLPLRSGNNARNHVFFLGQRLDYIMFCNLCISLVNYHTTWDILFTKLAKGTEPNETFCRYGVKSSNVSPSWNRSYGEKSMIVVPVSCERKKNSL